MRNVFIALLLLSIPLMYGCKEKLVTYEDSGTTVHLKAGDVLKVALPGNASTGNDWRKMTYDDQVIVKKGKPNYVLSDDRVGSPGTYYFKFGALAQGETKLFMEFGSKYDDSKDPVKTFELNIIVDGK